MTDAQVVDWLVYGAVAGSALAVATFLLSRFVAEAAGRGTLAIALIVAAGAYFGFAIAGAAGGGWILVEVAGCGAFGAMALLGLRSSAWWLAVGWALHPLWDLPLHVYGPGASFAPEPYAVACLSFDLVVAGYVAVAHSRGAPGRP